MYTLMLMSRTEHMYVALHAVHPTMHQRFAGKEAVAQGVPSSSQGNCQYKMLLWFCTETPLCTNAKGNDTVSFACYQLYNHASMNDQ